MQFPFSLRLLAAGTLCFLLSGLARDVYAGSPANAVIDGVEIGFEGYYKVGDWAPLFVTATSPADCEARLTVGVPDVDADMTVLTSATARLSAGKPFRFEGRFKSGRAIGELHIRIETDEGEIASRILRVSDESARFRKGLLPSQQLWVAVGDPAGLEAAESGIEPNADDGKRVVAHVAVEDLPSIWQSYSSADVVIVAAAATTSGGQSFPAEITDQQSAALADWVRCGGYLAFSLGQDVDAFQNSPLANWMPVVLTGQTEIRNLGDVESIAGERDPLPRSPMMMAIISEDDEDLSGTVVKRGRTGPVLVRVPYGLGRIAFMTVDVNQDPIKGWKAAPALIESFVKGPSRADQQNRIATSGQLSKQGITDLSSQFLASLQDWEDVPRISVWTVLGLIAVYILLIGPLDFWIVHRLLKKPELTWVTFPLFVVLVGGLAIWMSTASHGNAMKVKQASFIDLDADSGQMLVRSWFGVFSPENKLYTIEAQPQPIGGNAPPQVDLSWLAMAEDAVGGLNRQGGIHLADRTYHYGNGGVSLKDVPIGHWSAKSFAAQWKAERPGLVVNQLEGSGAGRMRGVLSHTFSVPLRDCVLAYGGQAYRIDTLAPYQQWRPNPTQSRELRSFLTGLVAKRKTSDEDVASFEHFFEEQASYDPADRDLGRVARMLTFHEVAGGASYTGLAHDVSPELDYSHHLRLGRAVLLAKADLVPTQLLIDGKAPEGTQQETYIRIVLPVKRIDASGGQRSLIKINR